MGSVTINQEIRELASLIAVPNGLDEVLERALAALEQVIPYDLAAVLELRNERLEVRRARGRLANRSVRRHFLEVGRVPTIRRVMETRRPLAVMEHDHRADEGDPYDGVLDLPPGHSCMVVPLYAGDRTLGIMTLDRTQCAPFRPEVVELAGVYGQIVSLAIVFAEQAEGFGTMKDGLASQIDALQAQIPGLLPAARWLDALPSPAMKRVAEMVCQSRRSDGPLLIQGADPVERMMVARALHFGASRGRGPWIEAILPALGAEERDTALFGGDGDIGWFAAAKGGTLAIEGIQGLSPESQTKLLTFLNPPKGVNRPFTPRIIVLADPSLDGAVAGGSLRADLHARLSVATLRIPPLRTRPEDATMLATLALEDHHRRTGRGPWRWHKNLAASLKRRPWTEGSEALTLAVRRAAASSKPGVIRAEALRPAPKAIPCPEPPPAPLASLESVERAHIARVLTHTEGRLYGTGGAAEILEMRPTTLQSRMKKLGIDRDAFTA